MVTYRRVWVFGIVAVLVVCALAVLLWIAKDQRRQIREYDFMAAAGQGNTGRVTELVDSVDVNARLGGDAETALHRAAARGHVQVVRLLLDHGAKVDAADDEGVTPLILAAWRGHTAVVKVLLDHGAPVNAREKRNGLSSLSHAVGMGDKELVTLLLARGADPSVDDLNRAAANGARDIAALLKEAASQK